MANHHTSTMVFPVTTERKYVIVKGNNTCRSCDFAVFKSSIPLLQMAVLLEWGPLLEPLTFNIM